MLMSTKRNLTSKLSSKNQRILKSAALVYVKSLSLLRNISLALFKVTFFLMVEYLYLFFDLRNLSILNGWQPVAWHPRGRLWLILDMMQRSLVSRPSSACSMIRGMPRPLVLDK